MGRKSIRTVETFLICSVCDNVYPMFRHKGKQKKDGHIKHLWCYRCKETTAHIEDKRLFNRSSSVEECVGTYPERRSSY